MKDSESKIQGLAQMQEDWKTFEEGYLTEYFEWFYNEYGQPLYTCITDLWYYLYSHTTLFNLAVIFLKYIPTCIYMYKFTKSVYITSRERLKRKQMELEEIELQIQIVNTKISVRDSECAERLQRLRRGIDELRRVRARVREVIAADSSLLRVIQPTYMNHQNIVDYCTPEQENDILTELLKDMKVEKVEPEKGSDPMMGDDYNNKSDTADSIYSSVSDNELKKECRLKIIRVTNVYKVAYLKHYIKQKRLRRANRQAQLKKKMESIKQLLDDWHETLNIVINSKLTLLNPDPHPIDVQSQEAMGDYSKVNLDDSDGEDMQNCSSDIFLDEYKTSWEHSTCNSSYSFDEVIERNCSQEYGDTNYCHPMYYEGNGSSNILSILPEETSSQIAIEELKNETDEEHVCHNLIEL